MFSLSNQYLFILLWKTHFLCSLLQFGPSMLVVPCLKTRAVTRALILGRGDIFIYVCSA